MSDVYRTLRDHCGHETAEAVLRAFGGLEIYVPVKWTAESPLNIMGEHHARRLIELYGVGQITVPRSSLSRRARTRLIIDLKAAGHLTINQIARQAGCTTRWVRRVVEISNRMDSRQGSLF